MDNSKNAITLIGAGIGIGVVLTLIAILFFGARPTNVHLGPVEFEIPTATAQAYQATVSALQTQVGRQQQPSQVTLPVQSAQPTQASTSQLAVQPTAVQFPSKSQRLSIDTLKQVLDETSAQRVEITLGQLRELCNQGTIVCYDHPTNNWSVVGPALVATDPLQQPIAGAKVVKVNKDSAGNWLPNWPIGLFYIPIGQTALVPTPGVAYPLETSLPTEWIIR